MRRLSVVAAAAVLLVGCGSDDPEPLPDLVGMTLREAEDAGRDGGFDVDHETDDGSTVWSAANWEVKSQQPAAGVAAGEVSLLVGRPDEPADDVEAAPDPEPTDEPQGEPDAEPEPEPEPDAEQPSGSDWLTVLEDQGAAYLEYVDRIEQGGGNTINVYMNRGDHREDEIVIGLDGETDRGVAMQLCFSLQGAGHDGQIVVHDVLGVVIVHTSAFGNSLVLDGAPECRRR